MSDNTAMEPRESSAKLSILQVESDDHRSHLRNLFLEYGHWVNGRLIEEYGISFDIEDTVERNMASLDQFQPPVGSLLLAEYDSQIAGCACLRKSRDSIGEIKRMYVRPDHRGHGIGRSLLNEALTAARQNGYSAVRLDSAGFMKEAQALYRSAGFRDIEPYAESEIPEEWRRNWVFMDLGLG